jgi:hypothetical protein
MKVDINRLKNLCEKKEMELWGQFSKRKDYSDEGLYLFKYTGAKILAVAHMDVYSDKAGGKFSSDKVGEDIIVHSPWLDDRLGVFIVDHMLPNVLKIKTDVLLTTNEECCMSTAKDFANDMKECNQYNWIVEFDRAGEDVVLYHYDDVPELTEDLKQANFDVAWGTYSDIGEMEDFGVGCFNVGVGYHRQHTVTCFASMQEMVNQLVKFQAFYEANKDKRYIYTAKPHGRWWDFYGENYWSNSGVYNWRKKYNGNFRKKSTVVKYINEHGNAVTYTKGYSKGYSRDDESWDASYGNVSNDALLRGAVDFTEKEYDPETGRLVDEYDGILDPPYISDEHRQMAIEQLWEDYEKSELELEDDEEDMGYDELCGCCGDPIVFTYSTEIEMFRESGLCSKCYDYFEEAGIGCVGSDLISAVPPVKTKGYKVR